MSSCAVDNFYATNQPGTTCVATGCSCSCKCHKSNGDDYGCNKTGCSSDGALHRADCYPQYPDMNDQSRINCCLGINLPDNSGEGYCGTNWCLGSDSCNSFFSSHCTGSNLESEECLTFCNSEDAQSTGVCDAALLIYCSLPENSTSVTCGCSLPPVNSNYPGITDSNPSLPQSCYNQCNNNTSAIKLSTQDACTGSYCILSNITINAISSSIGDITLKQDCGNTDKGTGDTSNSFYTSITNILKNKWFYLILGGILLLIVVFIIIKIATRDNGDDDDYEYVTDPSPDGTIDTTAVINPIAT